MTARRVISHEAAVRGGIRYFLKHATIDVDELATALAVSRATLYRVVGSREQLLGNVLWELANHRLAAARRARTCDGVDGVIEVTRLFAAGLASATGLRGFLATERETAIRVLSHPGGVVHERVVAAQKEIFLEVGCPAEPQRSVDLDNLARLYVRMAEAVLYIKLLGGTQVDIDPVENALRALLTSP